MIMNKNAEIITVIMMVINTLFCIVIGIECNIGPIYILWPLSVMWLWVVLFNFIKSSKRNERNRRYKKKTDTIRRIK